MRGIIVHSRSIVGTIGATLQTIVGGDITLLTNLCEETREYAFELMLQHAAELGGNAVIGMRYDATENRARDNRGTCLRNRGIRAEENLREAGRAAEETSVTIGEPGRNRTCDPRIKSALLYQLSYGPTVS